MDNNRSAWQRSRSRPGWDALLEVIRAGRVRHVIVCHPDRLMRQPRDLEELPALSEEHDITLHGQVLEDRAREGRGDLRINHPYCAQRRLVRMSARAQRSRLPCYDGLGRVGDGQLDGREAGHGRASACCCRFGFCSSCGWPCSGLLSAVWLRPGVLLWGLEIFARVFIASTMGSRRRGWCVWSSFLLRQVGAVRSRGWREAGR